MLLRRIEVENFRGLRSAVVELDGTTALIGENSAGKTTLLDAVAICCSGRDDRVTLEVRDFRQAGQSPPSESLGIALTFEGTDAEWADQVRAPFLPFLRPGTPGRRVFRLEVSGRRHPERNAVEARWTFAGGEGRSSGPQQGLLAEWRRLTPMLRLRANRYVEQDPRGTAAAAAAGGADTADATDPVARQLEQQIRVIYDRLTGASDIQDDELRRGLDAAEAYLSGRGPLRRAPVWPAATLDRRSGRDAFVEWQARRAAPVEHQAGHRHQRPGASSGSIGAILEARQRHSLAEEAQPMLVLEDVEAHLHPTTLSAMWELIAKLPAQKILTTNSGELLAAVPLRSIRRIVTDRFGTRVYRIDVRPVLGGRPAADCLSRPHQQGRRAVRAVLAVRRRGNGGVAAAGAGADSAATTSRPKGSAAWSSRRADCARCCGSPTTSASSGTC